MALPISLNGFLGNKCSTFVGDKKVLFFGPFSPPITGQSLAFKTLVNSYSRSSLKLVDTTKFKSPIINTINSIFYSLYCLFFDRSIAVVYFTCTRSMLGAIKDIPLLLVSGFLKKRIINHLHGADFASFYKKSGILKPLLRKGYNNIHTSVVLTRSMEKEFQEFDKMKIDVVHNFYPKEFDDKPIKKGEVVKVSFLSNLLASKGVMDFLAASKILGMKNPNMRFDIAGEFMGDHLMDKAEIKKEVENYLLVNSELNISFVGKLDPADRFKFLQESDIFVLPTFYPTEAVPLTIIEAMRCGNVIITTKHNYLPDLFSGRNGAIVSPRKINELVEAISKFCDDLAMMKKVQKFNIDEAKTKYSQDSYTSSLRKIINADE